MFIALLLLACASRPAIGTTGGSFGLHSEPHLSKGLAKLLTRSQTVDAFPLDDVDWARIQAKHAAQLECKVEFKEPLDVVFYGDSITEALRGTFRGMPDSKVADVPAVWEKHFGNWRALAFGIAGDRTMNMLWRLKEGGEAPGGLIVRSAVLLIGTNDFYNHYEQLYGAVPMSEVAEIVAEIASGILANVVILQERLRKTHIILLGILPRGDADAGVSDPQHFHFDLPSMFSPHIQQINEHLAEFASAARHVSFVDCGHVLTKSTPEGSMLDRDLVVDGIHPTAAGMDALLACIKPHLQMVHHRKHDAPDSAQ